MSEDKKENNKKSFDIAGIDQAIAGVRDTLPPMLWVFYSQCQKEGFTKEQSFCLSVELLRSTISTLS
jgi:hypothetical protein